MAKFTVASNQDIVNRAAVHPQPEKGVVIFVSGVQSLESALEMRRSLMLSVVDLGWKCPGLRRLSNLACLAAELRDVRDRLIPLLLADADANANANPFQDVLKLKNSGWMIRYLGRLDYGDGPEQAGPLSEASTPVANRILRLARRVMEGAREMGWMRTRLPDLVARITELLQDVPVGLPELPHEEEEEADEEGHGNDA